jgi:hypothetical protein
VPKGARVVEWYAGVGVLGLSLAPHAAWVRCSDVNPPHEAFEASRELLPAHVQPRVSYAVGSAAERVRDARGADAAVVDPPRKGLDPPLLAALCAAPAAGGACAALRTLVYVSCGFPALTRDADALLTAGWRVRGSAATAHVLFLGANHIETVVCFERGGDDGGGGGGSEGGRDDARPAPAAAAATAVEAVVVVEVAGEAAAPRTVERGRGSTEAPRVNPRQRRLQRRHKQQHARQAAEAAPGAEGAAPARRE